MAPEEIELVTTYYKVLGALFYSFGVEKAARRVTLIRPSITDQSGERKMAGGYALVLWDGKDAVHILKVPAKDGEVLETHMLEQEFANSPHWGGAE